jgi:hypothetical protein
MVSCSAACTWYGFSSAIERSNGASARRAAASTSPSSMRPCATSPAKRAACSPARLPNTSRSESELPPSRLAPCSPAAHSPAAKRPGTVLICVSPSTRTPPIT